MALVAVFYACSQLAPAAHAQTRVETRGDQSPAIVAGRDATVNYGTINYGYTPAQVGGLVAIATGRATADAAEARREVGDLRQRLGVTEGAALAMLRTLGQADVPLERLPQALADLTARHKELLERLGRLEGAADPRVAQLKAEARAAVERGDYDTAEQRLKEAEDAHLAAARRKREEADRELLAAAETRAERAGLAELRFRYAEAGRLYREAAELVPEAEPLRRATYLDRAANALREGGRYAEAEPLLRRALAIDERSLGPDHPSVARDLNNLAVLLRATNRLAEAEPLMRRVVQIFAAFTRATGHPHPHLEAAFANYRALLQASGWSEAQIETVVAELRAPIAATPATQVAPR
jgi:tetratricopeptide (TPR) repeat protein